MTNNNRPIDTALLAIAITIGLGIVAAALYSYYRSGKGDSISGRINRWLWREHPLWLCCSARRGDLLRG